MLLFIESLVVLFQQVWNYIMITQHKWSHVLSNLESLQAVSNRPQKNHHQIMGHKPVANQSKWNNINQSVSPLHEEAFFSIPFLSVL